MILKEVIKKLFGKSDTADYPFSKPVIDENAHASFEIIPNTCIGCKLCEKNCPAEAITVTNKKPEYNFSKCMYCGLCVYICPVKALRTTNKIMPSVYDKKQLILDETLK